MRFSGLSVRQLEAFVATMDAGSVSAAASAMNVSQPSVSRLLKDLEADTKLRLFDRTGGRLVPTDAALLLYNEAAQTFRSARDLMRTAQEIRQLEKGSVRVSTLAALSFELLPDVMKRFSDAYPSLATSLSVRESREIINSVRAGFTDVGLVHANTFLRDVIFIKSFEANSVCVMDKTHPLAACKQITIADFSDYPFVSVGGQQYDRTCDGDKLADAVKNNIAADTFQSFLACALVRNSDKLAVVDPYTAHFYSSFGLVSKALDFSIPFRYSCIENERSSTNMVAERFVAFLEEKIAEFDDAIGLNESAVSDK